MRWGKLSRASVSHPLCRVQGIFVYQRFAFLSPSELPSSASKSQITTPKILLCVELKMIFKVRLTAILVSNSVSLSSVQFSSVVQSCPTLCDPMNRSTPGLPVHHQLPEFTQTHVHRVGDAIQPSYPLSSPFSPVPNPSQHQSLFQRFNSSHEVAKVLEFQL